MLEINVEIMASIFGVYFISHSLSTPDTCHAVVVINVVARSISEIGAPASAITGNQRNIIGARAGGV